MWQCLLPPVGRRTNASAPAELWLSTRVQRPSSWHLPQTREPPVRVSFTQLATMYFLVARGGSRLQFSR